MALNDFMFEFLSDQVLVQLLFYASKLELLLVQITCVHRDLSDKLFVEC